MISPIGYERLPGIECVSWMIHTARWDALRYSSLNESGLFVRGGCVRVVRGAVWYRVGVEQGGWSKRMAGYQVGGMWVPHRL